MKRNIGIITGLDKYALTASSLFRLGICKVLIRVYVRHANQKRLFNLPPNKRKERMDELKRRNYAAIFNRWPGESPERIGTKQSPAGLFGWLMAKDIQKLFELPIQSIWVEKIDGRNSIVSRRSVVSQYFGVRAKYSIQVESYTTGMQSYEERILLVRAQTAKEAEEIVCKEGVDYGEPYLNSQGEKVRWALEKIVDVYDTSSSEIAHPLFEVYSELRSRRMKPERVWNPALKKSRPFSSSRRIKGQKKK